MAKRTRPRARNQSQKGQSPLRVTRSPNPVRVPAPKVPVPRSKKELESLRLTVPRRLSQLKLLLQRTPANRSPSEPKRPRHRCWIHLPIQILHVCSCLHAWFNFVFFHAWFQSVFNFSKFQKYVYMMIVSEYWCCCFSGANTFECLPYILGFLTM